MAVATFGGMSGAGGIGASTTVTLRSNLGRISAGMLKGLETVLDKGEQDIAGSIKKHIVMVGYVDTGATLNSVQTKREINRPLERHIGPRTEYAIYGEMGTSHSAPRPFCAPGLNDQRGPIIAAAKAMLQNVANREGLSSFGGVG